MFSRIQRLVVASACVASAIVNAAAPKPNVVLVMCDDLGWGDLKNFNSESPIHTPYLDAMAAAGMRFSRFYAAAPVCSPTRGACLTGRHPFRYGVYHANTGHMKREEITLPELLKEAGYTTGHFGKWHLGTLTTEVKDANRGRPGESEHFSPPRWHGYDDSFVTESKVPTHDPLIAPLNAPQTAWDPLDPDDEHVTYGTRYWNHDGSEATDNLHGDNSRIIMDRVIPFVEAAVKDGEPFFAAVWFHAPHLPVVAGDEHRARYAEHDVYARNYYGCITALDEQVGRLRATLRQLGVANNTMVWFCSDNGPEGQSGKAPGSAGPFRGRKRSLFEGGIRVPGVVEWPMRVKAGTATDFPAVTSDYLPTVLDALGIDFPEARPLDGISLLPLLEGKLTERPVPIGFQHGRQVAWMTHRYKLYSSDSGKSWELYDLVVDKSESENLAAENPALVRSLAAAVEQWRASCRNSDKGGDYGTSSTNH